MTPRTPSARLRAAAAAAAGALLARLRAAALGAPSATPLEDTVLLSQRAQSIEHFGASDAWVVQSLPAGSPVAARVAHLLFDAHEGAALSCWRFNLGGGVNTASISDPLRTCDTFETARGAYDWRRCANAVWLLRAAAAAGVPHALLFANSPPARLTRNGRTNCDDDASSCNLRAGAEAEYAAYLADIASHFMHDAAAPIPVVAVTPFNEPQWRWLAGDQEGCRAANEDVIAVAAALRCALDARALHHVRVAAPDSGSLPDMWRPNAAAAAAAGGAAFGAYAAALPANTAAAAALQGALTYHSYWSDDAATQLRQHRAQLAAALPPGWRLWQTEYCLMDPPPPPPADARMLGMDAALRVARVIHYDLTVAGATAWHWWLGVSCYDFSDGLLYVPRGDALRPDAAAVVPAKRLWALAHFSRFVRPGFVRVRLEQHGGAQDDPHGVMASAFVSPDGATFVAVYINAASVSAPARALRVEPPAAAALAALPLRRWLTDAAHDCCEVAPLTLGARFVLPPRSLVTLQLAAGGQS